MTRKERNFGPPPKELKDRPSRARYEKVRFALELKSRRRAPQADRLMGEVVEALWRDFADFPYSGCGFHILNEDATAVNPGHHRGKVPQPTLDPAGVLARAVKSGHPELCGDGGASRVAVPVYDCEDRLWAVFEAVSDKPAAFDDMDMRWLERIVKVFQLVKRVGGGFC
ncbi:MAG: GAF domain-containing protein [Elusimicrobia bacterium]|nr:GAF domain-containing protein [Elusimicrobiota bacterium]